MMIIGIVRESKTGCSAKARKNTKNNSKAQKTPAPLNKGTANENYG